VSDSHNDGASILDQIDPGAKPRIIGGQDATPGSYPFFVSLLVQGHACGGSLIAPDIVLSAAHCVGLKTAHVGRHVMDDSDTFEEIPLASEIRHPAYNDQSYDYDFMVLKLERPSTAPIIRLNTNPDLPVTGVPDNVKAIGFGLTEFYYDGSYGPSATVLQEVNLDAITNEDCMLANDSGNEEEKYANGYDGLIKADMLCAEGEGEDTCLGKVMETLMFCFCLLNRKKELSQYSYIRCFLCLIV
jgi:trypsin